MDVNRIEALLKSDNLAGRVVAARLAEGAFDQNKIGLYSMGQILFGSVIGGPGAVTYFLWKNLQALGHPQTGRHVLLWGTVLTILLFLAAPFFPDKTPKEIVPVVCATVAIVFSQRFRMSRKDILAREGFMRQPFWKVLLVTGLILVICFIIILGWVNFLEWIEPAASTNTPVRAA